MTTALQLFAFRHIKIVRKTNKIQTFEKNEKWVYHYCFLSIIGDIIDDPSHSKCFQSKSLMFQVSKMAWNISVAEKSSSEHHFKNG